MAHFDSRKDDAASLNLVILCNVKFSHTAWFACAVDVTWSHGTVHTTCLPVANLPFVIRVKSSNVELLNKDGSIYRISSYYS